MTAAHSHGGRDVLSCILATSQMSSVSLKGRTVSWIDVWWNAILSLAVG